MDRFDELVVFTAILDSGSLTAAARRLRRSSPAVTRALAALEQRAGTRLIERTTRRLSPTEAGRRLARQAHQLLTDYSDALEGVKEERNAPLQGLLRVTAPSLFGRWHVIPLVGSFQEAHPGMRVELVLTNRALDLVAEGIDVAVRIGPLTRSGLIARRVGQVRRIVFASPRYIERRGRPRTPKDLMRHDIVFNPHRPMAAQWRFRVSGRERAVRFTPKLMISDIEGVLHAVRAGRGIGRALSYQVADDLASGTVVRVLREFEPPAHPVHLVVLSARHMPPAVRAFLDHAARGLDSLSVIHD
jgi:DNA-binding transcriptional LysR family regulator